MVPCDKENWWWFRLVSEAAMCIFSLGSLDSNLVAFAFEFRLYPKDPPRPLALEGRPSGDLEVSRSIVSGELITWANPVAVLIVIQTKRSDKEHQINVDFAVEGSLKLTICMTTD